MDVEIIVRDGSAPSGNPIFLIEEEDIRDIHFEVKEISQFKKSLQKVRSGFEYKIYGNPSNIYRSTRLKKILSSV